MMCLFLMWDTSRQITRAERHHMNPMLLSARWIKFEFLGLQANAGTKERLGKKKNGGGAQITEVGIHLEVKGGQSLQ